MATPGPGDATDDPAPRPGDATDDPEPRPARRPKPRAGVSVVVGGLLADLEDRMRRDLPPIEERVRRGDETRDLAGGWGPAAPGTGETGPAGSGVSMTGPAPGTGVRGQGSSLEDALVIVLPPARPKAGPERR